MRTFTTDNKTISIFPCSESESPVIYLNTFHDESQKVYETAQATGCPPFTLVTVSDLAWNHDMAPWDSPAAFKKGEPFAGGADDYLRLLVEEIILSDGCVLTGGVHVWLLVVSWFQRVHLLPRAEAPAGLHLFLPGGQGGQDTQSGSENSSGEYRGNLGFLPGRGHRHSVPAEFWKPFCPGDRAGRRQASSGC